MEESGRVGCDGWAKEVDYAVTEDLAVARKNFMEFLQWLLFKDSNGESEDDFSQYSAMIMRFLWQLARDESRVLL